MKKWVVLGAVAVFAVLATGSVAQAEFGVGVKWTGNGITPNMVLPIKLQSGLVIEPSVGFVSVSVDAGTTTTLAAVDIDDLMEGTIFNVGVAVEKYMEMDGISPFFGADVQIQIGSPEVGDSWTDFGFGLFLGGAAEITDKVEILGSWGPEVVLVGERHKDGPTATVIGSRANFGIRWWLWGQ
ncbi:MAG TPA: hypothetical protein VM118_10685 [Acidobacteriota bacterium]|nr:hypothetical protein [Acidobacteriota bacterium]